MPELVERPIKHAVIGWIIDLGVEKLNWFTGYSFADVALSDESAEKLAAAVDAPITMVAKAAAQGSTIDERINALYEQYNIKPEPQPEPEPEDLPQQETIQAPAAPTPAPAVVLAKWDTILSFILKYEGGYVNDPQDPGGETNRGITKDTLAAAFAKGIVKHNVVKNITREDASKIYEAMYYKNFGYDKLPFAVSFVITDTTVHSGRRGAAKIAQRALVSLGYSLTVDGKWGPKTQEAFEKAAANSPELLAQAILVKRKNFFDDIIAAKPSQVKFRTGWYNRLKGLAKAAGVQSPV